MMIDFAGVKVPHTEAQTAIAPLLPCAKVIVVAVGAVVTIPHTAELPEIQKP